MTAENPLIDKVNADNSYRLKGDDLARVPSQARTIEEVVSFTPGVTGVRASTVTGTGTGLPSFRGEGDAGNNWFIDGLSTKGVQDNDPGVRINYDAWEEVQIISDGFDPDLGQSPGGFINVITKSGGNAFHGEIGTLIRDWHLRAQRQDQLAVVSEPDTSLHQFFGNLGGPILKDKLWFFVSNNFHRSLDDTEQQSIGWLTIPPGGRRFSTNNIFGKVTYTPQKNHTFSLSGTLDKFLSQTGGIGLPEIYEKTEYEDYSYRINYRGILSQGTLLTAAWGQNRRKSSQEPLDGDYGPPSYTWLDIVQTTNNSPWGQFDLERRSDFNLEVTQYLDLGRWGDHELGAGFIYYDNRYEGQNKWTGSDFDPWKGNGFDDGTIITWISPGIPNGLYEYGPGDSKNWTKGVGFHIKDRFTIGRLSLMMGLRAETQKIFNDVGETVWSWGLGDFLSPRFSLAFDLLGDGDNILKFSYGQFASTQTAQTLNIFNRHMSVSVRFYNWTGGVDPAEIQLGDPSNWEFIFEQSNEGMPLEVDPNLKPNKNSKFLLEFDRRLGNNWALKFRGVYSYSKNLADDLALYDPETLIKWVYGNFELKRRDYRALEVELNGRIANKFMLNASYTWSQAKGTSPGNSWELLTWGGGGGNGYEYGCFGDHAYVPEGEPDKELIDWLFGGTGGVGVGDEGWYGFLPYSVDHQIKILATYMAPLGFNISAGIEYLSGYHWEKKGLYQALGLFGIYPEGRGGRTTPAHMYVDLSIEKDFVLRRGFVLGLGLNVYNLFNSQRPISFVKEDTELFGQVWGRQLPRWLQFKFTMRF
ncbi:MAG: TonB-dependent receptor plug domain-containing protein [Candidatus Aminicenantales bacterium]